MLFYYRYWGYWSTLLQESKKRWGWCRYVNTFTLHHWVINLGWAQASPTFTFLQVRDLAYVQDFKNNWLPIDPSVSWKGLCYKVYWMTMVVILQAKQQNSPLNVCKQLSSLPHVFMCEVSLYNSKQEVSTAIGYAIQEPFSSFIDG